MDILAPIIIGSVGVAISLTLLVNGWLEKRRTRLQYQARRIGG